MMPAKSWRIGAETTTRFGPTARSDITSRSTSIIPVAPPACHRNEGRKLQNPAVQGWVPEHKPANSRNDRGTGGEQLILHMVSPPFLRLGTSQSGATLERRMPWERPLTQSAHSAIMGSNQHENPHPHFQHRGRSGGWPCRRHPDCLDRRGAHGAPPVGDPD